MNQDSFSVPFKQGVLDVTVSQAEDLIQSLLEGIERYNKGQPIFLPPVTADGYMKRESLGAFLAQFHKKPAVLRSHLGRLFGQFIWLASRSYGITMVCPECNGGVNDQSCISSREGITHHAPPIRLGLLVEVDSIKNFQPMMFRQLSRVGPEVETDYRRLYEHLTRERT